MWNILSRFAKGSKSTANARSAPKSQQAQELDELFNAWNSLTGIKLTGHRIQTILKDADSGYCSDQAALLDMIQEAEPIIGGHLDTRKRAALAVPWRLEGGSEKDRTEITRNLDRIGFQQLRRHSLDAIAHGYSLAALLWKPGGSELSGWREIHSTNVLFDEGGNTGLITGTGGEQALSEWHPNQFLQHIHKAKPGLPCRGSLLRTLVWFYFFKFYGIRDYARYIERFGIPFVLVKLSENDFADNAKTTKIISSLRSMGTNGVAVVTKGTETENQAVAAGGKAEFFNWFQYIDDIFALVILGQIASSKEANGMSNGDLQSGVKDDLTASDCEILEETFNNSLIKPLDRFRNGRETGLHIVFASEPAEDLQDKAELVSTLAGAGYKAKREWVEKTFEIPLEDVDKTPTPESGQESTKEPITPDDTQKSVTALSDAGTGPQTANLPANVIAKEEMISRITENTLRQLFVNSDTMHEFYRPLTAAINESFSDIDPEDPQLVDKFVAAADGFFEKYPVIYETLDTTGIERAVSGAMLASNINGYSQNNNGGFKNEDN
jgi:phage gp29-like protein